MHMKMYLYLYGYRDSIETLSLCYVIVKKYFMRKVFFS